MTEFLRNRRAFCLVASGVSASSGTSAAAASTTDTSSSTLPDMTAFENSMEEASDENTMQMAQLEQKQDELHQMQSAALKAFKEEDIS